MNVILVPRILNYAFEKFHWNVLLKVVLEIVFTYHRSLPSDRAKCVCIKPLAAIPKTLVQILAKNFASKNLPISTWILSHIYHPLLSKTITQWTITGCLSLTTVD